MQKKSQQELFPSLRSARSALDEIMEAPTNCLKYSKMKMQQPGQVNANVQLAEEIVAALDEMESPTKLFEVFKSENANNQVKSMHTCN